MTWCFIRGCGSRRGWWTSIEISINNPWKSIQKPREIHEKTNGNPWKSMEIHGNPWKSPWLTNIVIDFLMIFLVIFGREVMRLADATSSAKRRRDALGSFWPGECHDVNMVNPINNPCPIKVCQCLYHILWLWWLGLLSIVQWYPTKIARYPLISRLLSDESGAGSYLRHAAAARHVLRSTRNGEDHGSSALRWVLRCGEKHVKTCMQRRFCIINRWIKYRSYLYIYIYYIYMLICIYI